MSASSALPSKAVRSAALAGNEPSGCCIATSRRTWRGARFSDASDEIASIDAIRSFLSRSRCHRREARPPTAPSHLSRSLMDGRPSTRAIRDGSDPTRDSANASEKAPGSVRSRSQSRSAGRAFALRRDCREFCALARPAIPAAAPNPRRPRPAGCQLLPPSADSRPAQVGPSPIKLAALCSRPGGQSPEADNFDGCIYCRRRQCDSSGVCATHPEGTVRACATLLLPPTCPGKRAESRADPAGFGTSGRVPCLRRTGAAHARRMPKGSCSGGAAH